MTSPLAAAALAELQAALTGFALPTSLEAPPQPTAKPTGGFFLPDAFTNPAHVQYALKTTGAAMFCYLVYSLLDWPGIHTCLITVYIVSLGTTAETMEKLTLRIAGCLVGAAAGIAAIVFLMPLRHLDRGADGDRLSGGARLGLDRRRQPAHLLCRLSGRLRVLSLRRPGLGPRLRHDRRARPGHRHAVRQSRRRARLHA